MPRRSLLSASERDTLLAIPASREELIRLYTLSESDLSLVRQHRGAVNRLGFAVQLCYMRYPGIVLEQGKERIYSTECAQMHKAISCPTQCSNILRASSIRVAVSSSTRAVRVA